MAESGRKSLVWDIRKSLLILSAEELFQVAKNVGPVAGQDRPELEEGDQEGCFDHISSFMYSKHLLELEDSGMVELLMLKDSVDIVVKNRDVMHLFDVRDDTGLHHTPAPTPTAHVIHIVDHPTTSSLPTLSITPPNVTVNPSQTVGMASPAGLVNSVSQSRRSETSTVSLEGPVSVKDVPCTTDADLREMPTSYEELGRRLRQSMMLPDEQTLEHSQTLPDQASKSHTGSFHHTLPSPPMPQHAEKGAIALRDVPYLPRREFKVQGGQVGDHSSDISYNNICKQTDEGTREGFLDTEIVRGVLRIIKPGIFKDMLINKEDLTVMELKGFLQTHLREKKSTELFQELRCARQDDSETPQQFLYRVIELKQRILFTSKLTDAAVRYSSATVQDVFLHTVYQGLGYKHSDIRRELKPLLTNCEVSDGTILRQVMRITSEESERQRRLGAVRKQTMTSAHSAQLESNPVLEHSQQESPVPKARTDPISQLAAKVDQLTSLVEAMRHQGPLLSTGPVTLCPQSKTNIRKDKYYGCPACTEQNRPDCRHCFSCGEEGHRAVGCAKRHQNSGNVNRSLQWGTQ